MFELIIEIRNQFNIVFIVHAIDLIPDLSFLPVIGYLDKAFFAFDPQMMIPVFRIGDGSSCFDALIVKIRKSGGFRTVFFAITL